MSDNLYKAPASDLTQAPDAEPEYAGFWIRTLASLVDTVLAVIVMLPVLTMVYGFGFWSGGTEIQGVWKLLFNYVLPAAAVIMFWVYKSATPGKMLFGLYIVDANTGGKASTGQLIGRYAAYYVSTLALLLGFFWVAFDARKQGWHDKLAGTLVVKKV